MFNLTLDVYYVAKINYGDNIIKSWTDKRSISNIQIPVRVSDPQHSIFPRDENYICTYHVIKTRLQLKKSIHIQTVQPEIRKMD